MFSPSAILIGLLFAGVRTAAAYCWSVLVAVVLSVALLSGCVATPETQATPAAPRFDRGYAAGWADREATMRDAIEADIRADERQRIIAGFDARVSALASARPDTSESWLNDHGKIPLKRMAFAREEERRLKIECAIQFDALADAYVAEMMRLRSE